MVQPPIRRRDRPKHRPVAFRPPDSDRAWLLEHARSTGRPVGAVLRAALSAYRKSAAAPSRLEQLRAARAAQNRGRTT